MTKVKDRLPWCPLLNMLLRNNVFPLFDIYYHFHFQNPFNGLLTIAGRLVRLCRLGTIPMKASFQLFKTLAFNCDN